MSGSAIGLSMNYGFPGTFSRTPDCIIEAKPVKSNSANIKYGKGVVLNTDNTFSAGSSVTFTAANFAGVAVAIVKQLNTYSIGQDVVQENYYAADQMCDVLQRGIISVECVHGDPTACGAVYIRKTLNSSFPAEEIGDFRADADGGNTVQLTNCSWNTNLKDANNVAELKIKTINN